MNDMYYLRKEFQTKAMMSYPENPFDLFQDWWDLALEKGVAEPNAMVLATAGAEGQPSVRTVLLKSFSVAEGFVFFTNYKSRKAQEITQNPKAALLFYWKELERQVTIEGLVYKTPEDKNKAYFASRPRTSQIGAWVSEQSQRIAGKQVLEAKKRAVERMFSPTEAIPCPDYWGGYYLLPNQMEFWQGGSGRLHDRCVYIKEDKGWQKALLAP